MRNCRAHLWGVILPLLAFTTVSAQVRQGLTPTSWVDWTSGRIIAVAGAPAVDQDAPGAVRVRAFSELKMAAFRNLWDAIRRIRLDSTMRIAQLWRRNPESKEAMYRAARGFILERVWPLRGDSLFVQISLPVGRLQAELRPVFPEAEVYPVPEGKCPICGLRWRGEQPPSSTAGEKSLGSFTGLIVVADSASLWPALAAKIVDDSGRVVYDAGTPDSTMVLEQGLLAYADSASIEGVRERVGDRPLVVEAINAGKAGQAEIVISRHDAMHVRAAALNDNFMRRAAVAVLFRRNR